MSNLHSELLKCTTQKDKIEYLLNHQVTKQSDEKLGFGIRFANHVAKVSNSWIFLFVYIAIIIAWIVFNFVAPIKLQFDPYPNNFIGLVISVWISVQSFLIGLSQARQIKKQKQKDDYEYEINLKTEMLTTEIYKTINELLKNKRED